jgi:SAM-dependent methyltransferase
MTAGKEPGGTPAAGHTRRSFADKWHHNPALALATTLEEGSEIQRWILERNGFSTLADFEGYLSARRRVLDAGCGNGRVTALLRRHSDAAMTEVVGIDLTAASVARENLAGAENVEIHEWDLLGDLRPLGTFDFIYCQEVLHHTAEPERAFANLCGILEPGGEIAIYVYRQKAPLREYADDFVRDRISELPYEEAMVACEQITALGRAVSDLDVEVEVPAVDLLGIEAGKYPVHRFLYHFFLKCFWNAELSFQENAAINYDWYHPQLATRHTMDEVLGWFERQGLKVCHTHLDPYGITVRGAADRG